MKHYLRRLFLGITLIIVLCTLIVCGAVSVYLLMRSGCPMPEINRFAVILLISGAMLCLLILCLLHFLSDRITRRLLRPLHRINDLMHTSHTDAEPHIDEFEDIQPIMDNISAMIRKLHYDMDEITRTQQMRRDFVANASHELKSPLTSIKGFAELIAADMVPSRELEREYLGRIIHESNRLLSIIDSILRLNKAESGDVQNVTQVDLRAAALESAQALESIAAKKDIHIEVAGQGFALANPQEIWELVYNLMDNGIRYGRKGGFVNVRIDPHTITVIDNGIGLEASQLPRIFERFYRVDRSHTRFGSDAAAGGTGLGLSIVRNIALKYGGDVSVTSTLGEGSTFTVRLKPPITE